MKLSKALVLGSMLLSVGACSYPASVASVSSPLGEIRTDRHVDAPAHITFGQSLQSMNYEADLDGIVCTAHNFPVDPSAAIRGSILQVVENSFSNLNISPLSNLYMPDSFNLKFDLVSFRANLGFNSGYWTGTAVADSELVLRVTVHYEGAEVYRTTLVGNGNHRTKGGCDAGAQAIGRATEKAVARTVESLVYKVINTGELQEYLDDLKTSEIGPK